MNRTRLRRLAAIAVTIVAAAASLATSPNEYSVGADSVSGRLVLSPEDPEVRVPFTVGATAAAVQGGGFTTRVTYRPVWTDTDQAIIERGPDVSVKTPAGMIRSEDGMVECWEECLGANELILGWPSEAATGVLTLEWNISAFVEFGDVEPPEDASITLEATAPPSIADPVLQQTLRTASVPMTISDIRISTNAAITSLAIHRPGPLSNRTPFLIGQDDSWIEVPVQHTVDLSIPEACSSGPCELELRTVALQTPKGSFGEVEYELVAATGEAARVTATEVRQEPWAASASSGPITLALDETTESMTLALSASLPAETAGVPVATKFIGQFVETDNGQDLEYSVHDLNSPPTGSLRGLDKDDEARPFEIWRPVQCEGSICSTNAGLTVRITPTEDGTITPVGARLVVTVHFLFPHQMSEVGTPVLQVEEAR